MGRLVHFEIHATQPAGLVDFYSKLLGWKFTRWAGPMEYWLIETGEAGRPGINGGLVQRRGPAAAEGQAVNAFVCTADVDAIDASVQKAQSLGATVAVPKMPIPGVGWLAYVKDPDGNLLGLMQADPKAA
jgi:hypothetical protein